jgi:hypothetical protein
LSWAGGNASLSGYRDDNGDGLADGNDGGLFSGWDIVGAQNVRGTGGREANHTAIGASRDRRRLHGPHLRCG